MKNANFVPPYPSYFVTAKRCQGWDMKFGQSL
jgi:hypothetical protein